MPYVYCLLTPRLRFSRLWLLAITFLGGHSTVASAQAGCAHYELDDFVAKGFDTGYGACLRVMLQLDQAQTGAIELEMLNAVSQLEKTANDTINGQLNTVLWSRAQAHEIISRVLTPSQYVAYLHDRIVSQIPPLADGEEEKKPRYWMVRKLLGQSIDMRAYKAVPLSNKQRQNIVRLLRPYYREKKQLEEERKLNFNSLLYYRVVAAQALDASLSEDQKNLYSLYNRFGFDLFDHGYVAATTPVDDDDEEGLKEPSAVAAMVKEKLLPPRDSAASSEARLSDVAPRVNDNNREGDAGEEYFASSLNDLEFLEQVFDDFCASDHADMEGMTRALEHRFAFEALEGKAKCKHAMTSLVEQTAFGRLGGHISALLLALLLVCVVVIYQQRD